MTFKEKFNDFIGDITNKFTSLSQEENNSVEVEKEISEGMPALARQAAAEGAVCSKTTVYFLSIKVLLYRFSAEPTRIISLSATEAAATLTVLTISTLHRVLKTART